MISVEANSAVRVIFGKLYFSRFILLGYRESVKTGEVEVCLM